MDPHRSERLAELIRESLHELINFRLSDPRIGSIDVVAVVLSPDNRKAVIRISSPDKRDLTASIDGLRHAKAFLRKELAATLDLFRTPDLYFEAATKAIEPGRLPALLQRVRRGRPRE